MEFIQIILKFQDDQLPLRTAGYCLRDYEVHGEVTDWIITYLGSVKSSFFFLKNLNCSAGYLKFSTSNS